MKLQWLNVSSKYLATDLSIIVLLLICIFTNCLTLTLYFIPSYSFLFLTFFFFGNRILFGVNFSFLPFCDILCFVSIVSSDKIRQQYFWQNSCFDYFENIHTGCLCIFKKNLKRRQITKFLQAIFIFLLSSGSDFIHSLESEYCWIARDSEPVISLKLSLRI